MSNETQDFQNMRKALGRKIEKLRLQKGWSQMALAELSGLSVRSISRIERGQPKATLTKVGKIASTFGITLAQMFRGTDASLFRQPPRAKLRSRRMRP